MITNVADKLKQMKKSTMSLTESLRKDTGKKTKYVSPTLLRNPNNVFPLEVKQTYQYTVSQGIYHLTYLLFGLFCCAETLNE
mmetsp:Transcript_33646/g.38323  ORF Transcript_33646/g.38323 Transcript_33646/m.38323 type:complete len:82 (+) Transcript_33646:73-318(+)